MATTIRKAGDLELRITHRIKDNSPYMEIVHWFEPEHCYTICYWPEAGTTIELVGARAFASSVEEHDFFKLLRIGTNIARAVEDDD